MDKITKKIFLDVSELEAPAPLSEILKLATHLKEGELLIVKHRMFPCQLMPYLDRLNLTSTVREYNENMKTYFEIIIEKK